MLWIIALAFIGVAGMAGYYRGPICAAFSFVGLIFGIVLAGPLSPLTRHLLPLLGFHHAVWNLFIPGALALVIVLIIFKIVGNTLHQKMCIHFKYQRDERLFIRWERVYQRLGFCVAAVNGVIYFFLLMLPVYVAGYFTTEVGADDLPLSARVAASLRAQLHDSKLDRVVANFDPTPPVIYEATEIADLVRHNPLLVGRLSHYPPLLTFAQQPQIQDLMSDLTLQQMIQTQAKIVDVIQYPKVLGVLTNVMFAEQLHGLLGDDLGDLKQFLLTGKSAKYDGEKLLGIWDIDVHATLAEARRLHLDMPRAQIAALHTELVPLITGLSFTVTTDNQIILRKQNPNSTVFTAVGQGTWKNTGSAYEVALAGNRPNPVQVTPSDDGTFLFERNGRVLIFNKEM
jgi:hypothetical protein